MRIYKEKTKKGRRKNGRNRKVSNIVRVIKGVVGERSVTGGRDEEGGRGEKKGKDKGKGVRVGKRGLLMAGRVSQEKKK